VFDVYCFIILTNSTGHILLKNCLLKCVIEGKIEGRIEVTGRQHKRLLDHNKEARGCWKLKEEALAHTLQNSLWKGLWTCRKIENRMDILFPQVVMVRQPHLRRSRAACGSYVVHDYIIPFVSDIISNYRQLQ